MVELKAAPNEDFWAHVDGALRELHALFLSRGYASLAQSRTGIPAEEFANVLIAVVALHDVGKAFSEYQKRIAMGGDKWSVPKHEYYSALVFWRCSESLLEEDLRQLATTAIMLHHIATRGPEPRKALIDWRKYNAPTRVSMSPHVRDELVQGFSKRVGANVLNLGGIPLEASIKEVEDLLILLEKPMKRLGSKGFRNYTLTLFMLRPIIVCDCRAAGIARSGSLKVFVRDFPNPECIRRVARIVECVA